MECTRASEAWSPDTGQPAGENVARLAERVLRWKLEARLFHTFTDAQGYCAYDTPASGARQAPNTTTWLPTLRAQFEAALPAAVERLTLGQSYEGRPIYGYRLGPASRPHVVVTALVHGNEGDGHPGTYKGWELLATDPAFAPLREQFTIFMAPELNPDGYYHWTRGLAHQVDGKLINLNRVFDWFWNEYLESSSESKGEYPEQPNEAQALTNYWRTGNAGGQVGFACLLDVHGTEGDGFRYQSRERLLTHYDEGDDLALWFDWFMWVHCGGLQAKRVREHGAPDLWMNYYRSRFRPHLHPYFQTRTPAENAGIPPIGMVVEHNKVEFVKSAAGRGETYASACNLHLDYITTMGLLMQGGAFEKKTAVLVEGFEATQLLENPKWHVWQPDEYRPSYYSAGRCAIDRATEHFLQGHGTALELNTDLDLVIPGATACRLHGAACGNAAGDAVFYYCNGQLLKGSQKSTTGNLVVQQVPPGLPVNRVGMAMNATGELWIIGDGEASKLVETSAGIWQNLTTIGIGVTGLEDCAVTADDSGQIIIAGGQAAGVVQDKVYRITNADAFELVGNLSTPVAGANAFVDGTTLIVVAGQDASAKTLNILQQFDLGTGLPDIGLAVGGGLADGAAYAAGWRDDAGDIWLYGGFHRADLVDPWTAIGDVHRYDASEGVWEAVELFAARYDEQDLHDSDSPDRVWSIGRGGWAAAPLHPEDEPDQWQVYVFGGGPDESDDSLATDEIRVHDVRDDRFVKLADSDYGYIRKNVHLDALGEEIAHDDFTTDQYSFGGSYDLTLLGNGQASINSYSSLKWDVGAQEALRATIELEMATLTAGAGFQIYMRSIEQGPPHYMLALSDSSVTVNRVNGPSETLLNDSGITLATGTHRYAFTVQGSWPVVLELQVDGQTVWVHRDYDTARLVPAASDDVTIDISPNGSTWYINDLRLDETLYDRATFAAAVHCKAIAGKRAPHVRLNLSMADALTGNISARRCRNYYLAPPSKDWWWLRGSCRMGGYHSMLEHELRFYLPRVYKDAGVMIDAPMLCTGLRPSSWMPEGMTRKAEAMRWYGAVDLAHLHVAFDWLPTMSFLQLEQDTTLLRLVQSSGNAGFRLDACVGSDLFEREYNRNDVYGPVEPALELVIFHPGGDQGTCRIPIHWGTNQKDTIRDLWDDHIHIEIKHVNGVGMQLEVTRGLARGTAWLPSPISMSGLGNIELLDGGYFSAPEVAPCDAFVPEHLPNGALLAGDRDPTWGKVDEQGWNKGYLEDFTRADYTNLGPEWDQCLELEGFTEKWQIVSNGAELHPNGHAYERWDSEPRLAMHQVEMQATLNAANDEVGLLLRMDASDFYYGRLFGYKVALLYDGSQAILTLQLLWHDGAQQQELLATDFETVASGTFLGAVCTITAGWSNDRDRLEVTVTGPVTMSALIDDTRMRRPGAVGIYGRAAAAAVRIEQITMSTVEKTEITQ